LPTNMGGDYIVGLLSCRHSTKFLRVCCGVLLPVIGNIVTMHGQSWPASETVGCTGRAIRADCRVKQCRESASRVWVATRTVCHLGQSSFQSPVGLKLACLRLLVNRCLVELLILPGGAVPGEVVCQGVAHDLSPLPAALGKGVHCAVNSLQQFSC